jgi:hypothetical protein
MISPQTTESERSTASDALAAGDETLLEVLDRLLNTGVVLCGEVNISVADVDLICLRLQVALSSTETAREAGWYGPEARVRGPELNARGNGSPRWRLGNDA